MLLRVTLRGKSSRVGAQDVTPGEHSDDAIGGLAPDDGQAPDAFADHVVCRFSDRVVIEDDDRRP